jgi:hypothetical protein
MLDTFDKSENNFKLKKCQILSSYDLNSPSNHKSKKAQTKNKTERTETQSTETSHTQNNSKTNSEN